MDSIFIFGPPRSGTTFLSTILNSNERVLLRFQPLFSYVHKNALDRNSKKEEIEEFLVALMRSQDEFATMTASFFENFPTFQKTFPPTHLVIKEVSHLDLMDTILSESNSKIIGIIRDPLMTINSWVNASREWDSRWDIEEEWYLGEKKHQENPNGYYGLKKWIRAAKIMEGCKSSPNFLLLRYEDLVSKEHQEVERLHKFSNLTMSKQTLGFLEAARNSANQDPYSVFRGAAKLPMTVPSQIRRRIIEEVETNELGRYLS